MLDEEGNEEKELEVQVLGSKVIKNRKVREITLSSRNYKPFSIRNKDGSVVLKWDVFEAQEKLLELGNFEYRDFQQLLPVLCKRAKIDYHFSQDNAHYQVSGQHSHCYGSHSCRKLGAKWAMLAGSSIEEICLIGGWSTITSQLQYIGPVLIKPSEILGNLDLNTVLPKVPLKADQYS